MNNLEPLFCEPVYKDYIWGGNKLKDIFDKIRHLKRLLKVGK